MCADDNKIYRKISDISIPHSYECFALMVLVWDLATKHTHPKQIWYKYTLVAHWKQQHSAGSALQLPMTFMDYKSRWGCQQWVRRFFFKSYSVVQRHLLSFAFNSETKIMLRLQQLLDYLDIFPTWRLLRRSSKSENGLAGSLPPSQLILIKKNSGMPGQARFGWRALTNWTSKPTESW